VIGWVALYLLRIWEVPGSNFHVFPQSLKVDAKAASFHIITHSGMING
jgi:hypothetical protein